MRCEDIPMSNGWREVPALPVELLAAIGNVAIAFATLDVSASMLLSRGKSGSEAGATYRSQLGRKLDDVATLVPHLRAQAERMKDLAETRNDLMHGYLLTVVWSASDEAVPHHIVSNFGRGRSQTLSVDVLDGIAHEVSAFAQALSAWIFPFPPKT